MVASYSIRVAMIVIFIITMYTIHAIAKYFVSINPIMTLLVGFTILISIAVYFDKKERFY